MKIENCGLSDMDAILPMYEFARELQKQKKMVVWPVFETAFIEKGIAEKRQWKLVADNNQMVCTWTITFEDKDIWEEKDNNNAIYIHRIATYPDFRGKRFIDNIVEWAKAYTKELNRKYVRLDTLGNNQKLIEHYTFAGFNFLGVYQLANIENLPGHYHTESRCLLFELPVI